MISIEKQKLLLNYLYSSNDLFTLTNSIVNDTYFEPELRNAVTFVKNYFEEYHNMPSPDQIFAESGFKPVIEELNPAKYEYAIDEIEDFCKKSALRKAILNAPKHMEEENYSELERSIKEAITTGLNRDGGLDYFENVEDRLKRLQESPAAIATGLTELDDHLDGGVNRKELTTFMANSGVGKSIVMSNLAVNFVRQGLNVVYITLELAEDVVGKRFDSMFSGVPQSDIFKSISKVAHDIEAEKDHCGNLTIKRMPESATNANHIRAFLKEYEMINGVRCDVLIIDYLDLMTTNNRIAADNLFVKDKYVTEEIRSIGNDFNCVVVSASQMGRTALEADDIGQGHIQGGISKVNTTDNLIAIIQTEAMRSGGEYIFKLVKTRSSAGAGKSILLRWNPIALRVTDANTNDKQNSLGLQAVKIDEGFKPDPIKQNDPLDFLNNTVPDL